MSSVQQKVVASHLSETPIIDLNPKSETPTPIGTSLEADPFSSRPKEPRVHYQTQQHPSANLKTT